jgi:hypothetical protein
MYMSAQRGAARYLPAETREFRACPRVDAAPAHMLWQEGVGDDGIS